MKRLTYAFTLGVLVAAVSLAAQTNTAPVVQGRSACVPYEPAGLKIEEVPGTGGTWRLTRGDDAVFKVFADREDAEAGLAVARQHTQLCFDREGEHETQSQGLHHGVLEIRLRRVRPVNEYPRRGRR